MSLTATIIVTTCGIVGVLELGRVAGHRFLLRARTRRLDRYDEALLAIANEGRDQ